VHSTQDLPKAIYLTAGCAEDCAHAETQSSCPAPGTFLLAEQCGSDIATADCSS
jgi:hypothetical protein